LEERIKKTGEEEKENIYMLDSPLCGLSQGNAARPATAFAWHGTASSPPPTISDEQKIKDRFIYFSLSRFHHMRVS
jgi:hypothetical protein